MKVGEEQFEAIVGEALADLPEKFRQKLNNVAVIIQDFPTRGQLDETGEKDRYGLLGLYEGYNQSAGLDLGPVLPDRIYIFRRPLCRDCATLEECREQVKKTVRHELAHYFGLDEKGARRAEKRA